MLDFFEMNEFVRNFSCAISHGKGKKFDARASAMNEETILNMLPFIFVIFQDDFDVKTSDGLLKKQASQYLVSYFNKEVEESKNKTTTADFNGKLNIYDDEISSTYIRGVYNTDFKEIFKKMTESFKIRNFFGKASEFKNEQGNIQSVLIDGKYTENEEKIGDDLKLFAIFQKQFNKPSIIMYNYMNKSNDDDKEYRIIGSKEAFYSGKKIMSMSEKPSCKGRLYISKEMFKQMINKMKEYEDGIPVKPFREMVTVVDFDKNSQEVVEIKELVSKQSKLIFNASDMTLFPMFPVRLEEIEKGGKYFYQELKTPEFQNPSKKDNIRPFVSYEEVDDPQCKSELNKDRRFTPKLNECKQNEGSIIESITSLYKTNGKTEYRLVNVYERRINWCYPANEGKEVVNFKLGTLVSMIVRNPFKVKEFDSKIVLVNFKRNKEFVGYPELIRANKETFIENKKSKNGSITSREREWLAKKGLFDFNNPIKRIFGVLTAKRLHLAMENPFLIPALDKHPDFIVIYDEEISC